MSFLLQLIIYHLTRFGLKIIIQNYPKIALFKAFCSNNFDTFVSQNAFHHIP